MPGKIRRAAGVFTSGVAVTIAKSSGTGNLTGTTTQNTDATGRATFNDLVIDQTGPKQFTATATGPTTAVNATFNVGLPVVSGPLAITNSTLTGDALIIRGSGGTPGGNYNVLNSPNVALPMASWGMSGSSQFDPTGEFHIHQCDFAGRVAEILSHPNPLIRTAQAKPIEYSANACPHLHTSFLLLFQNALSCLMKTGRRWIPFGDFYFAFTLPIILLCGCVSFNAPFSGTGNNRSSKDHGYALLYDLMGDERDVSKLLIIKRERPEFGDLIKDISRRSDAAHQQLERFAQTDAGLNLKNQGLPSAEVATRESVSKARGKELLTDKGKDFELHLLLSQEEALTYGTHLADVMIQSEGNAERARFLRELSNDLNQLHHRLVAMLLNNYQWSPKK